MACSTFQLGSPPSCVRYASAKCRCVPAHREGCSVRESTRKACQWCVMPLCTFAWRCAVLSLGRLDAIHPIVPCARAHMTGDDSGVKTVSAALHAAVASCNLCSLVRRFRLALALFVHKHGGGTRAYVHVHESSRDRASARERQSQMSAHVQVRHTHTSQDEVSKQADAGTSRLAARSPRKRLTRHSAV